MLEISFTLTADQKKSTENEKETEKAKTDTKSLNEYSKRDRREKIIK